MKNQEQDRRIGVVEKHIATINDELGSVKVDLAQVKTDVNWLKRNYWIIVTASVGAAMAAITNLLR